MHIYKYVFIILLFVLPANISAQTFISLDWEKPEPIYEGETLIPTEMPGFAGAFHYPNNHLPYYATQIDLGRDYAEYTYNVKVEYPEFVKLSQKDSEAVGQVASFLPDYPLVGSEFSISAKHGILDIKFLPLVYRDGTFHRINSFKLTVEKKTAMRRAVTRAEQEQKYADNSVLASGKWIKIRVNEAGVHKITNSELSRMGFSNPSNVRLYGYGGLILHEDVRKSKIDDLQEVPLWRESDFVLFYANGTIRWEAERQYFTHKQNHYSTYSYYFLTESEQAPKEFPKEASLSEEGAVDITTFPDYALWEKEAYSWREGGRKLYDDYDYRLGNTQSYTFDLPGIVEGNARATVAFSAYSTSATTTSVAIDGANLGELSISRYGTYDHGMEATGNFDWNGQKQERTVVRLTHNRSSGASGRLDFIRLNFMRRLGLYGAFTQFRPSRSGKLKYVVASADANTRIWNISDPLDYKQMEGTLSDNQFVFVADSSEYVAVNIRGTFSGVEVVGTIPNQNLHSLNAVDMIIITPSNNTFITQAERLADAHRQKDGLTVEVVTSEQVYNEFSSGTPDASAYRWLMKMLYDRASTEDEQPKYLLLFGDGAYDNRMLSPGWKAYKTDNFLLTFVSENSTSEVNSYVLDDYFGFLDDGEGLQPQTDKVDIGVGRLPIRTNTQARQVVDKLIAYMNNNDAGAWKTRVCFFGDDGTKSEGESSSGANIHMEQADELATAIEQNHPEYQVKRIYWDAYKMEKMAVGNRYPLVTEKFLEYMNDGMLVMNYTGHGGPAALSHEYAFVSADVSKIHSERPSLWVTAACEVAPFDAANLSLGELGMLYDKGGAVAVYSTTRTVYSHQNARMNEAFMKHLFDKPDGKSQRLGDIVRKTKVEMAGNSSASINNLHFVFLGDPAMKLTQAEYKVVIDEFNGVAAEQETTIKAGGVVNVKGRVLDSAGSLASDFDGVVFPTIMDNIETITTRNNNGYAQAPFVFESREKTLFSGSTPVKQGEFSFTFPVPLDINYSNESGLVNLYALAEDKSAEAQGYYSNFLIGGTEEGAMRNDSLGPKINVYLNTLDFITGDKVNETPYLIAVLEDEDGINTSGNGIGHDLVAIIDNSSAYTFILNGYFEPEIGSYTQGTVRYSLPELPEGKHQLLFRAWDIKNNSSTTIIDFEVIRGLTPNISDVDCIKSPVNDETEFIIHHNRPGSEVDLRLSIHDLSGQELWVHKETFITNSTTYQVPWTLVTGDGRRIAPGMYLYSASISSDGSKETTKAKKIIVLAQ